MTNIEFVGNEALKNHIESAGKSHNFPHSYLIYGEVGSGKKVFAKMLAKALLCIRDDDENESMLVEKSAEKTVPCNHCKSCNKVESGIHPDCVWVYGEDKKAKGDKLNVSEVFRLSPLEDTDNLKALSVKVIRSMCADTSIIANESERKVYIIPMAEQMTVEAQNALLKVLEEPPKGVVIIMLCSDTSKILPTIKSRALKLTTENLEISQMMEYFSSNKNYVDMDKVKIKTACYLSGGSIGLATRYITDKNIDAINTFCNDFITKFISNEYEFALLSKFLESKKGNIEFVLNFLLKRLYFQLTLSNSENILLFGCNADKSLTKKHIMRIIDIINETIVMLNGNGNFNLCILCMLTKSWEEVH